MRTIAIDAMGGEHAPAAIVEAVWQAKAKLPQTKFVLFGQVEQIKACLPGPLDDQVELVQASEIIKDEDEPVKSIRRKKDSSLVRAANYVKAGKADALLSLGNTGALLASGIFIIGRLKGVKRPALMPTLPATSERGSFHIIDVGANAEAKPEYLLQWAELAALYAQTIEHIDQPKVGLLNNGAESDKGDPLHQTAYQLLSASQLNFTGNIEANELLLGKNDIVVSDGFSGNVALKSVEGGTTILMKQIKSALVNSGLKTKIGAAMIKPALVKVLHKFSTARHGGAVLLGVAAPVVKTHGRSDAKPIYYTLLQLDQMLSEQLIQKFEAKLSQTEK
ncbi:MAG: phosphate acyltransferase PlsX [Lactobacillus sp.]|jgi:glycerol-3-phosphate acyltransferase PlsX|nr:phosphate acyltransferase PlsX [Lactobacillus sp.]